MELQAVIMAGGRGSRMTDLTACHPKALLPIGNKPMVWYPIRMLENAGFEEAIIVVQQAHKSDIHTALVEICSVKLHLEFVTVPPNEDWGTADTLRHIRDKIKADLLVLSCDTICDLPLHMLADLHRMSDATVTMLLAPLPDVSETPAPGGKASRKLERDIVGMEEKNNRVVFLGSEADYEETITLKKSLFKRHPCIRMRMKLMDGHIYLIKKCLLDFLAQEKTHSTIKGELLPFLVRKQFSKRISEEKDTSNWDASLVSDKTSQDIYSYVEDDEMMNLAQEMSSSGHRDTHTNMSGTQFTPGKAAPSITVYGFIHDGLCIRANTTITYCEANRQITKKMPDLIPDAEVTLVHPTVTKPSKSTIGGDSMVGEGTSIGEKVAIKHSIIGQHCTIKERVKITNSIIMDHVTIQEGSTLTGCVICNSAHIGQKAELKDCLVGSSKAVVDMGKFTNEVIIDADRMIEI